MKSAFKRSFLLAANSRTVLCILCFSFGWVLYGLCFDFASLPKVVTIAPLLILFYFIVGYWFSTFVKKLFVYCTTLAVLQQCLMGLLYVAATWSFCWFLGFWFRFYYLVVLLGVFLLIYVLQKSFPPKKALGNFS